MTLRRRPPFGVALLAMLALGAPAAAEEPAAAPSPIDPKAVEQVRAMSAALAAAKAFTVDAEIVYDEVMHSGRKLQFAAAIEAAVRRPGGLAIEFRSDLGGKKLWYDGKSFTLLDLVHDAYATAAAPATTTAMLDEIESKQGISFPLMDFLADDPAARLLDGVRSAFLVGPGDVDGKTCRHLAFSNDAVDWQLWIDEGEKPLPCKVVITYRSEPSAPQYTGVFSGWAFPKSLADGTFAADLPGDAHEVEFVSARTEPEEKKP
jgi:hypothetical protein